MMSIDITGVPTAQKNMKGLMDVDELEKALIREGLLIEGDAKMICTALEAVDTSRLRSSISTNWPGSGSSHGEVMAPAMKADGVSRPRKSSGDIAVVRVGSNVKYAVFVHEGTRKMAARPFIDMAVMRNINNIQQDLNKYFEDKGRKI